MGEIIKIFGAATLACTIAAHSYAMSRIVVAGDGTALGSADTTIVNGKEINGAYMPAQGLRNPASSTPAVPLKQSLSASGRGETLVCGIYNMISHDGLAGNISFEIQAEEGAVISDFFTGGGLSSRIVGTEKPLAVVWMQGSHDIPATDPGEYSEALKALQESVGAPFVIMQPATQGFFHACRPSSDEEAAPRRGIADAMLQLCIDHPDRFKWGSSLYNVEYCSDMISPDAYGQELAGAYAGMAIDNLSAENKPIHVMSASATDDRIKLTMHVPYGKLVIDTISVAKAENYGFSVVRGSGTDERHLNITSVKVSPDGIVEITTNETVSTGDMVCYGSYDASTGPYSGCRGNLRDTRGDIKTALIGSRRIRLDNWCPLFTHEIKDVSHPSSNISGTVTCEGDGVAGVAVSDGYAITTTDTEGRYFLSSNKKLGYVFYTLPSGYEPETEDNGWQVKIYSQLATEDVNVAEVHDFRLKKIDNDRHIMVVGADSHLANRNSDLTQFRNGFITRIKKFIDDNPGTRIYSTILGDLTWDQYWTSRNYGLEDFVATMTENNYPLMLFPVMGNHDNDPAIPSGSETDFLSSAPFRRIISPTYYSYNLGKVHYIVLDDIVYKNTAKPGTSYGDGIAGSRDYGQYYTDEQLEWLRKDLSMIKDRNTPIVVTLHIQNWALSTDGKFSVSAALNSSSSENLAKILSGFPTVHILSGHTHYNYHAHPPKYTNIHENNIAAICATWWWTGKLTDRHICKDGSPGGFASYTADGEDISWKFHSIENNGDRQFRIYDMNVVKNAYLTDAGIKNLLKAYPTRTNYGTIADNTIYVNVFNYDTDWKVEIYEGEKPLQVTRICAEDPLHTICYDVPRYSSASTLTEGFASNRTNHIFMAKTTASDTPVTVHVTDSFGNTWTEKINRPGVYDTTLE